jgi:VWFA-related protein
MALVARLAVALFVVAAGLRGQDGPPPASVFGEAVEVRVVNLEVVVTDRYGVPVAGLAPEDFRLIVDGDQVTIGYFTEVRGGVAVAPAVDGPAVVDGVPELAPGEPVGTSYLVFVDDFFTIARDRNRVLGALRDQVSRLQPEDRMAIVASDGQQLTMLSTWTSSPRELERALREAAARPAHGLQRVTERRSAAFDREARGQIPGFTDRRFSTFETRLDPGERLYAEILEMQLRNLVSSVSAALRGFANPPGRKVLILLSGGWPYEVDDYVSNQFGRVVAEPGILSGERLYAPIVDTANQVGYTIFAVDVPGLGGEGFSDVSRQVIPENDDRFASFLRENNLQVTLDRIARATGGEALLNARRLEALPRAEGQTRSYYWIGFVPTWQGDDARHRVEVEVRQAGLQARTRSGYVDFSRRSEVSAAVESTLLFGSGPGERPLALTVGAPERSGGQRMRLPIVLELPTNELTWLPAGGEQVSELELRVAAIDDKGGRSEIPVVPVRIAVPGDREPAARARYETTLELRRTRNRIVVAVYDPVTGALWSATADVRP